VRSIRNKMTKEYLNLEKDGADFMELEKLTLGSLRKAVIDGDVINGTLMAGQIAGLVKEEKTCKEIILEIMEQGEKLLHGF
ncbi:MAG: enoyl-[acyl-carrier-protein] reductase FabK, partial [Lachnospiraceae bacterium]